MILRLAIAARTPYYLAITDPTKPTLADIEADLEISEAQAALGETVPLESVLARLRASLARMEAQQAEQTAHTHNW